MIHRTFRSLDEAPKLVGFTIKQWAALIAGARAVLGFVHVAHLPTKPAITLCVFVIGLPAALTYVSESGGLQLGVLLRDDVALALERAHAAGRLAGAPARARGCSSSPAAEEPGCEASPARDARRRSGGHWPAEERWG